MTFAYNTAKQNVSGSSPFYLLHGREAKSTLYTIFSFCLDAASDFTKHVMDISLVMKTNIARRLAKVPTLEAEEKDRLRYNSKHRMFTNLPVDLGWNFTPVQTVSLSE